MDKKCACCGSLFRRHAAVREQRYCSATECQKERKRIWQKEKLASDSDYRKNQSSAQMAWNARNSGYWRKYRKGNPLSVEQNRLRQRERDRKRRCKPEMLAKMDELNSRKPIATGRYRLTPVAAGDVLAKMDELIVEIGVISEGSVSGRAVWGLLAKR